MAIVKNATFQGASLYEVDTGAVTLTSTLKNVQGDAAAMLERITDKTVANSIDHSGPGRGCPLGIPPVNQLVRKDLKLDAGNSKNGGRDANRLLFPWLVYIPPGEEDVDVDVVFRRVAVDLGVFAPVCRLSSPTNYTVAVGDSLTAAITAQGPGTGGAAGSGGNRLECRARFRGCAAGLALLVLDLGQASATYVVDGVAYDETAILESVTVRFARGATSTQVYQHGATNEAPVQAPTASQALFFQQMDDSIFAVEEAITGFHTSRLDANLNGLAESVTGAPAFGNATYTHTESALSSPSRDRFRAFTRRTFANEPLPKIPVASHNYGGIKSNGGYLVDPATPASVAARQAFAPYATSSASVELGSGRSQCPDVPSGTMRWAVLVGQSSAVGFTNVRAQTQIEGSAASALVTPTALTGATFLGIAQGTGLAFPRDSSVARLRVFLSQAAGIFDPLNYCLLTAAVWIEE
jgi:hypothetical protein